MGTASDQLDDHVPVVRHACRNCERRLALGIVEVRVEALRAPLLHFLRIPAVDVVHELLQVALRVELLQRLLVELEHFVDAFLVFQLQFMRQRKESSGGLPQRKERSHGMGSRG